jgi:CRISPR-associated protein Cmr2
MNAHPHYYDYSAYLWRRDGALEPPPRPRLEQHRLRAEACDPALPTGNDAGLTILPTGSFLLRFDFTLATPYASKDDTPWDKTENEIVKEWVYRVPMVRPTTWKGNLRFAARQDWDNAPREEQEQLREEIRILFGNDKEEDDLLEGRLHFFPTFFTQQEGTASEVLSPHDRVTRMGRANVSPVTVKSVGRTSAGTFCLLYAWTDDRESKKFAELCCRWIQQMFCLHGFGAKKLKGWGLARNQAQNLQVWRRKPVPPDGVETTKLVSSFKLSNLGDKVKELLRWE